MSARRDRKLSRLGVDLGAHRSDFGDETLQIGTIECGADEIAKAEPITGGDDLADAKKQNDGFVPRDP
jgi:hypothetical protein